ncbi:MAG: universal stress protein [Desulfobacterales bacterium]
MRPKIMVLFDSATIRRESLQYAIALAKRTNSDLSLLVILPFEVGKTASDGIRPMLERGLQAKEALKKHAETIRNADIAAETTVRIGNPRSELVKYLAETGRFEIIIWGAKPDLMKSKDHWLVQMKTTLGCQVVTPFKKNEANMAFVRD